MSETFNSRADPATVSIVVFDQNGDNPNGAGLSTLFTPFGQVLDHDMMLSPEDHNAGTLNLVGMPHDIARSQVAGDTTINSNVQNGAQRRHGHPVRNDRRVGRCHRQQRQ